jgi:hypothetical protein
MSFTQTRTGPRRVEIDGHAHTLTTDSVAGGELATVADLGIAALALPGHGGSLARAYALVPELPIGLGMYAARPVSRIVVAVGLAFALEDASAACRRARAFAAEAGERVTVRAFLQTLPATNEIPQELRWRRVLAVAAYYDGPAEEGEAVLAPLRAGGTPLLDLSAPVPHEVVAPLERLQTAILS